MYEFENQAAYEYDTVQMKLAFNTFMAGVKSSAVTEYDNLLNKRSRDGWELVSSTFVADVSGGILVTFRKLRRVQEQAAAADSDFDGPR